jgi:hypothetical protein
MGDMLEGAAHPFGADEAVLVAAGQVIDAAWHTQGAAERVDLAWVALVAVLDTAEARNAPRSLTDPLRHALKKLDLLPVRRVP